MNNVQGTLAGSTSQGEVATGVDAAASAPVAAAVPRQGRAGIVIAALAAIALGGVGLWQAGTIRQPSGYQALGPRVFPTVISLGLLALGTAFLCRVTLRPDRWLIHRAADEASSSDLRVPLVLVGALVAYAFALRPAGYVLATAVFFPIAARQLGSEAPVRDAVVGVGLAVGLFELFTELLGVRLPAGLLGPLL